MISSVTGTTIFSRASARSRYSNCPLHWTVVPGGSFTSFATRLARLRDIAAEIAAVMSTKM